MGSRRASRSSVCRHSRIDQPFTVEERGDRYSIAMDLDTRGLAEFRRSDEPFRGPGRLARTRPVPMPTEPRCAATASIVLTASIIVATVW
jgi:hypothetical protein